MQSLEKDVEQTNNRQNVQQKGGRKGRFSGPQG
jgi:hypothetical protein